MEERRNTEITDTSKLDTSRWMPLPRYVPRGQQSAAKRSSRDEQQENVDESTSAVGGEKRRSTAKPTIPVEDRSPKIENQIADRFHSRSHSADVTILRNTEKRITEQRRNTGPCSIATRLTVFHVSKMRNIYMTVIGIVGDCLR